MRASSPNPSSEIDHLLDKYRGHRVPPLQELIDETILDNLYREYARARRVSLAFFWPNGDPQERASWEPLKGIYDLKLDGPVCQAWKQYKSPNGRHPLREQCEKSDIDHVWQTVARREGITYVCHNGLIHLTQPVILEGRVIAVVVVGQLRPKPGEIWDTANIEGVKQKGQNIDLWGPCSKRIKASQKLVGDSVDIMKLANEYREAGPKEVEEFRQGLHSLGRNLRELAQLRADLEKNKVFNHIRLPVLDVPQIREQFWPFLSNWFKGKVPDDSFLLALTHETDPYCVTVALSIGLPEVQEGKHEIEDRPLWKRLKRAEPGQLGKHQYRVTRLLKGYELPSCPTVALAMGKHGLLIYGVRHLNKGLELWEEERGAAGRFSHDIGLLLDVIDKAEAKEAFLTTFSHELRSPITSAGFTLDRIRRRRFSNAPEALDEACRLLQAQLNRLLKLIEGVWELQLILAGQAKYKATRMNTYDCLAHCAAQAEDMSDRDDLGIVVDRRSISGLPAIEFDRRAFDLVAFNLLDNAVKYSSRGTEIRIYGRREGDFVHLTFTNVGIRIPSPDELDVFQRFTRTNEARCRAPSSSGVGLFLVKNIIEAHGGNVDAHSKPHGPQNHLASILVRLPIRQ